MITIPLTKGYVAIVDDGDAHLAAHKWHAKVNRRTVYARRAAPRAGGPQRYLLLHREVLGFGPGDPDVDHRDGNGLDCRRGNLRTASSVENQQNMRRPRHNSSGFKGVQRHWRKWIARIHVNGRCVPLGSFRTPEEAAQAYDAAARLHFGAFARLNLPARD